MTIKFEQISVILPAKNESQGLVELLTRVKLTCPGAEIILVNDGSTDDTESIGLASEVIVVNHPYSKGNGASIKSGLRQASREWVILLDGDGQHPPEFIPKLINKAAKGYDLVVGARTPESQASLGRLFANSLYNKLASLMVNQKIPDLTSGFRMAKRKLMLEFIHLLPNGFSYPTTSTMAFFRAGYSVGFETFTGDKREGKSHISIVKDGIRFFLIIFKVGSLYSPFKIFFPVAAFQVLLGLGYYLYTYLTSGTFTNMTALVLSSAVIVFLIGLVSEQITMLMYKKD